MTSNKKDVEDVNEQLIRELEEHDPDLLVGLLGISSVELIAAFPSKVDNYLMAMENLNMEGMWDDETDGDDPLWSEDLLSDDALPPWEDDEV